MIQSCTIIKFVKRIIFLQHNVDILGLHVVQVWCHFWCHRSIIIECHSIILFTCTYNFIQLVMFTSVSQQCYPRCLIKNIINNLFQFDWYIVYRYFKVLVQEASLKVDNGFILSVLDVFSHLQEEQDEVSDRLKTFEFSNWSYISGCT